MIPLACCICPGLDKTQGKSRKIARCGAHGLVVTGKDKDPPCGKVDIWSNDFWVQQDTPGFGDMILMTCGMQAIARVRGTTVPIFFADRWVKECFVEARFMTHMDHPGPVFPPMRSGRRPRKALLEWSFAEAMVWGYLRPHGIESIIPNPYIDRSITEVLPRSPDVHHVAVFHGASNPTEGYIGTKDLGPSVRRAIIVEILNAGMVPVLLGSGRDYDQFWRGTLDGLHIRFNYLGKTRCRDAVSLLNQCDGFVSNDTGLAHAAGALRVPGVSCWKTTPDHWYGSPFKGQVRSRDPSASGWQWMKDVREFLRGLKARKPSDARSRFEPSESAWEDRIEECLVPGRRPDWDSGDVNRHRSHDQLPIESRKT